MKLLFLQPAADKERQTSIGALLVVERSPNGKSDWRTSSDSFFDELAYELQRHEEQFIDRP